MTNNVFERWLQSRLTSHGYTPGPIDGVIGRNTYAAIRRFQKSRSIPVTGQADKATIDALKSTSSQNFTLNFDRNSDAPVSQNYVATRFPHQRDLLNFYGPVGTSQTKIEVPWRTKLAWDKRRVISGITVHEKVADSATRALNRCYSEYGDDGIAYIGCDLFGGSLNVRRMRGGSRMSTHSWGIAIDWDPIRNQLRWKKPKARLSHADCEPWWRVWEEERWVSLGRERDFDWMHVQAARL